MNDAENQDMCEWQPKAVSIELLGYLGATEVSWEQFGALCCVERISQVSQVVPIPPHGYLSNDTEHAILLPLVPQCSDSKHWC